MQHNSEYCKTQITIRDGNGAQVYLCALHNDHSGPHETLYKEMGTAGPALDITWQTGEQERLLA